MTLQIEILCEIYGPLKFFKNNENSAGRAHNDTWHVDVSSMDVDVICMVTELIRLMWCMVRG